MIPFVAVQQLELRRFLLNRKYVGIDLEEEYLMTSKKRLEETIENRDSYNASLKKVMSR